MLLDDEVAVHVGSNEVGLAGALPRRPTGDDGDKPDEYGQIPFHSLFPSLTSADHNQRVLTTSAYGALGAHDLGHMQTGLPLVPLGTHTTEPVASRQQVSEFNCRRTYAAMLC
jgi:hypothetical protein